MFWPYVWFPPRDIFLLLLFLIAIRWIFPNVDVDRKKYVSERLSPYTKNTTVPRTVVDENFAFFLKETTLKVA